MLRILRTMFNKDLEYEHVSAIKNKRHIQQHGSDSSIIRIMMISRNYKSGHKSRKITGSVSLNLLRSSSDDNRAREIKLHVSINYGHTQTKWKKTSNKWVRHMKLMKIEKLNVKSKKPKTLALPKNLKSLFQENF